MLLLLGWAGLAGHEGAWEAAHQDEGAAISSYDNNSNNPRCGTDQLRGVW
jgi:hypothetical protein